jgi:hypothetical protein
MSVEFKAPVEFLSLKQRTPVKFYDGSSGKVVKLYQVDEYPTEDELELLRWEAEGGQ